MDKSVPDIILAICPPWGVINPPLGLAYLSTNLKRKGFKVEICDLNLKLFRPSNRNQKRLWEKENDHLWRSTEWVDELFRIWGDRIDCLIEDLLNSEAPVIGFSIADPNEAFTCRVLRVLKDKAYERTIIAGGPGCSSLGQRKHLLEQSNHTIDYFVVGEGEDALAKLLRALETGRDPAEVPGVVSASGALAVHQPVAALDLSTVAFPTFEEFDLPAYSRESLAIMWSRGCVGDCLYCKERALWGKYRPRTVSSIMDELRYHVDCNGFRNFVVYDSAVNGRPIHLESICDAILDSSLDITWSAEAIALPSLKQRLLHKMRAAGCHTLVFGIESGSDNVLAKMGKAIKSKTAEDVLRRAHKAGIKVAINILVGFPGEYERDFEETLNFLRRNQSWIDRLDGVSTLQVVDDTPLQRKSSQLGLILPSQEPHDRWYTKDGNTFEVRQQRLRMVLDLAQELSFEIGRTFTEKKPNKAPLWYRLSLEYIWRRLLCQIRARRLAWSSDGDTLLQKKLRRMFGNRGIVCEVEECEVPVFEGIRDGSKCFIGPEVVHLDLTNRCNMDCIACWYRSPLLGDQAIKKDILNSTLPLKVITELIDDLAQMGGVRKIMIGGGGEPTMHAHFKDVLTYIKSKVWNIELEINTNFTLVDENLLALMMEIDVDLLTVSLWAGSPCVYARTHPNQSQETFRQLVDRLKTVAQKRRNGRPRVSIHNVIMNLNYDDVITMLKLSLEIGADEMSYVLMDPVPGKTDHLLLNEVERLKLSKRLKSLRRSIDHFDEYLDPLSGRRIRLTNFSELLRRLSQSDTGKGFYDKKAVERVPCYIGWIFTRILADGTVVPCCKGHRLAMGNLHQQRFKEIWHSAKYSRFRRNGLRLNKSHPYYSVIGNELTEQTGCYNCDNLMHNLVIHRKVLSQSDLLKWVEFELFQWIGRWL